MTGVSFACFAALLVSVTIHKRSVAMFVAVRLYDINTLNCYVSSDARDQHTQGVTSVSEC